MAFVALMRMTRMARSRPIAAVRTADPESIQGAVPAPVERVAQGYAFIAPAGASYKWWVAATVMLSTFFVGVSGSSVNVALPPIMTAFGLNIEQGQWIITAYIIAGAVLIPTVGWLGNCLGNRNLFLLSLLVFVGGSALCGLAWSGPSLIVCRILQGMGGGPITPMAMVFLVTAFPERQRGLAMGLYATAASLGPAVGPVLGGYITEYLTWRMVFYLNIMPGVVGMLLVLLVIPNTREAVQRSLDWLGLVTLAGFMVSLLLALTQGQREGWDAPVIQGLFVVAGVSFVAFLVRECTCSAPLVELRLYTNLAFSAVSLAILLNAINFWGTNFLQTLLLQRLLDYTPAQAGWVLLPGALAMACTTVWAGRLADSIDRRYVILGGLTLYGLASYWFSFLTLERPMSWIVWMIMARYVTIGFIFTPMNAASTLLLPRDKVRMGSGLISIMQHGIGGASGLAMMTTLLERRTTYHASLLDQQQVFSPLSWREVLGPVHDVLLRAGEIEAMVDLKALEALRQHLVQQATIAAYQDCFVVLAGLCGLVMPFVWFLRRTHR
jgi:MFS transporter, DHA2 family, multidrug resistance protein